MSATAQRIKPWTTERARDALRFHSPSCTNDEWVAVGMALHDEWRGDEAGLDIWDEWSSGGDNYRGRKDCEQRWKTFKAGGGRDMGYIHAVATCNGWKDTSRPDPIDPAVLRREEEERAARMRKFEEKESKKHAIAAKRAAEIWDKAKPAPENHPYLDNKKIKPHGCRVGPWTVFDPETGQDRVVTENALLIPIKDRTGKLWSIQAIFPEKDQKLGRDRDYLLGGKKAGNFAIIGGETKQHNGRAIFILAEGFATSASVHEATEHRVFACMDAGNLAAVARAIREKKPEALIIVAADHDKDGAGERAAQRAAEAAGGFLSAYTMPKACPDDFSDLWTAGLKEQIVEHITDAIERAAELEPDQPADASAPAPASETQGAEQTQEAARQVPEASSLESFWAHLPSHKYIFVSTGELWPSSSVNGHLPVWPLNAETSKPMKPNDWLDRHRAVQQMSWHPGRPRIVEDEIVSGGGWARCPGARVFNLYRAPDRKQGNADDVAPWLDHLKAVYPNEWRHIQCWMAHRIQRPGEKINHALVLGGSPGIGKDTILEPVKMGVGSWNWSEVSPQQIVKDQFNPWVQSVVARISELRDLKEDRFGFYETMKVYTAAPPDTLRINQKHIPEYYVPNVMGVIFTTNNRTDGLYLPAEDRRHYVAWSEVDKDQFDEAYWKTLWDWIYAGGAWNVVEYLRTLDLSGFNCKAPPERTPAFWAIVHANNAPEDAELFAALGDETVAPDAVVLEDIIAKAHAAGLSGLAEELSDRKARRSIPHKLGRAGYVPVHNPDAKDGLWAVGGKRVTVYAKKSKTSAEQILAARRRAAPADAQPAARYQPTAEDYSQPPL